METKRFLQQRWKAKAAFSFIMVFTLTLTSCYIETGVDGRPGEAFIALDWEYAPPTYLDAGTSDIPALFRARPGYYSLYYEGEFYDGYSMAFYGWQLDYEIWRNYGAPGGPGYNGYDGADTYFTLILSPLGPYSDLWQKSESQTSFDIIEEKENLVIIQQKSAEYTMEVTYKKIER